MGESLNELSYEDLRGLEQDMETSLKIIRDRKVEFLVFKTSLFLFQVTYRLEESNFL